MKTVLLSLCLLVAGSIFAADSGGGSTAKPSPTTTRHAPILVVEKTFGTISLFSDLKAEVYLDGATLGPIPCGSATIRNVSTGFHRLVLKYEDGQEEGQNIMVLPNQEVPAVFRMKVPTLGPVHAARGVISLALTFSGTLGFGDQTVAIPAGEGLSIGNLNPGDYPLFVTYPDGEMEMKSAHVALGQTTYVLFTNGARPPLVLGAKPADGYRIGDQGPDGGIVFAVTSKGYLEAAPQDVIGTMNWVNAGSAARLYRLGGLSDWRLPNKEELNLMSENLFMKGLGNFSSYAPYWSSSETDSDHAIFQIFGRDGQREDDKNDAGCNVRLVREFQ